MASKFKQIQLQMLDQHLTSIQMCDRPSDGWIGAIRKALGMSMRQLGKRIGVTQQSASRLEANEIDGSITLKSLRKVAEGLDCQLIYALVPLKGRLQNIVYAQALKKAKEIVEPVYHTMLLESQEVGGMQSKIREIADELSKDPSSKLWD
ncbi:MAG: transcriptional regulator, family [Candidatus Midichloriaceae bacterium]|nr:transcriptional regulator, family [Candidatus Midichloriaceae bacterium]